MKSLMQKSLKSLLLLSLLAFPAMNSAPFPKVSAESAFDRLVLKKNSSEMLFNGQAVEAVQPVTFKDGVSYAPFKSMAKIYGFKVSYEAKTKESIARNGRLEIRFTPDTADIKVNGQTVKSSGAVFLQNGFMMIPLRTWAQLTGSALALKNSEMTFTWTSVPKATFAMQQEEIFAGQTIVTYLDLAESPMGRKIEEELWEGKQDIFSEPGIYVITRWVKDETGQWSEPYSVTIQVLKPNEPPVAAFETDKTLYRLGEPVYYTESSYDDEGIAKSRWTGKAPVFFTPGEYVISLEVEDRHGLTNQTSRRITVTDEVLYAPDEYYRLFTPAGDKFPINGSSVLIYEQIGYKALPEPVWLARSNSPEALTGEGIVFYDTIEGKIRFLFHNQNATDKNLDMYLVATNPNNTAVSVSTTAFGMGGPNRYVSTGGKLAVSRFLNSMLDPVDDQTVTLQPGQSGIIIPQMSQIPLKAGQVMSAYADLFADSKLEFRVVVVDSGKEPIAALQGLSFLERDNKHVRGTFNGADRTLEINGLLGEKPQRIPLGDRSMDKFLEGIDGMNGYLELNLGNFGVLYKMKLEVAPRTLIAINARGGHYAGAFLVNGKVVNTTDNSILKDKNEAGVLYRTGNTAETVEISFVLASGSNLPIQMIFEPLPAMRN